MSQNIFPLPPIAIRHQLFSANGTFTVPAGVTSLRVTVVGGGGLKSCCCCHCTEYALSGGSGGAAIKIINGLTPGQTISVTVGGVGGTSSFGTYCSATGAINGSPGVGVNGDVDLNGSQGVKGCFVPSPTHPINWYVAAPGYFGLCNYGSSGINSRHPSKPGAVLVEWLA
jgi:hypothetical protein